MRKYFLCLILPLLFLPTMVLAEDGVVQITPNLVDEKAKAGDILKYDVTIVNTGAAKIDIYAMVNDITELDGEIKYSDPSDLDKTTSVARWISFKRGAIELMPGATGTVPLSIDIPSGATPGKRFARIALPFGSNRGDAQGSMGSRIFAQLPISIEIMENIIEKTKIAEFSSMSTMFVTPPIGFNIKLENNGNKPVTPTGNIYIYNRRGEEVASLNTNSETESVAASETWQKNLKLDSLRGLGKFKAKLEVEYGEKDKRDLQDTLYFWYFPWKFLALVFVGTFLFLAIMVTLIFNKTYTHHRSEERSKLEVRRSSVASKKIVNLKK